MASRAGGRSGGRDDEAALRGLIGGGGTRLPGDEALRAREVSRPSAEELERAENELVIRHARPVEDPGGAGKGAAQGRGAGPNKGAAQGRGGRARSRS